MLMQGDKGAVSGLQGWIVKDIRGQERDSSAKFSSYGLPGQSHQGLALRCAQACFIFCLASHDQPPEQGHGMSALF
jgi:hypothetical protein